MNSDQIKNGVIRARRTGNFDGWVIIAEALLVGIMAFAGTNNALVGLAAVVISFKLLSQRAIGAIASLAFGGITAWWAGQNAYMKFGRWDVCVAVGIIAGFVAYSFHRYHVRAFERG